MKVAAALAARQSVRAFTDQPVPRDTVAAILRAARQAPSGANLQPGRFHVLAGAPLAALSADLVHAARGGRPPVARYTYFPDPIPADLKARQRAAGFALYAALGIEKRDLDGRRRQFVENYRFFGAPVGVIVTIRKGMGSGCYMDLGMSLMALMLSAQEAGLATCGIGALANHADVVQEALHLPEEEVVVCGLALGHADLRAPVNGFRTERDALEIYADFHGF